MLGQDNYEVRYCRRCDGNVWAKRARIHWRCSQCGKISRERAKPRQAARAGPQTVGG